MERKFTLALHVAIAMVFTMNVHAQEFTQAPIDTLTTAVQKLQSDLALLKKLKFTGYVQAQFQVADSAGEGTFAGGNFPTNADKRFTVRRGRLKATYTSEFTQLVLQVDASERGMRMVDAFAAITEPRTRAFTLTVGVFDRPFGFEVPYSSNLRETPERGRMSQTIFPNERDLGAKIAFQPPKTSRWNFLRIEGGMFNGTGGGASDFDTQKDFIGNIGINRTTKNEKVNYAVRASYYKGGYREPNKFLYDGVTTIGPDLRGFKVDSTAANLGGLARREYIGADAQLNLSFPFGMTTLRAEYITGTQPGTAATSVSPAVDPAADTYIRKFDGAYFYFLQNLGQSKHQVALKYDQYDPDTKVSGDQLGKPGSKLSKTDVKYTTLGLGWVYRWDANVRFTVYYDMVTNETSKNLVGFTKEQKDNVLTLRVQYKF
jgi:hypothetical protein